MSNFIKIILSSDSTERKKHINSLLASCGKDETYQANVQRAIEDASSQLAMIKQNVEAFHPLADLLGLPASFIHSVATDFIEEMDKGPEDLK